MGSPRYIEDTMNKTCTKCKQEKPLSEFYRSSNAASGRMAQCSSCIRERSREYNKKNREKASPKKTKKCVVCGTEFTPYMSTQKYCGASCTPQQKCKKRPAKGTRRVCRNCKKVFCDWPARHHTYCSKECYTKWRRARSVCVVCKKWFLQPKSRKGKVNTCSALCASQFKQARKVKKSLVDKKWSLVVRAKTGNKCEYCGITKFLNAHHIISRSNHATRWDLDNGVSLCAKHHLFSYEFSAHKNPVEFIEWIKEYRGEEWYQNLREKARCKEKVDKDEVNKYLTELLKEIT